jgi:hypothetical protein
MERAGGDQGAHVLDDLQGELRVGRGLVVVFFSHAERLLGRALANKVRRRR